MAENTKKISDDFSSTGQVSAADLQQAAAAGFKSLLNLRYALHADKPTPDEANAPTDEQQQAEAAGLHYANTPISNAEINPDQITKALWELEKLPKPVPIHCAAGARAGAIALIATAEHAGLTPEQLLKAAQELAINPEQLHLKYFVEQLKDEQAESGCGDLTIRQAALG